MTIQRHLDTTFTHWHKSSYSWIEGEECIDVSFSSNAVGMRDSHDPHGTVLAFGHGEWAAFLGVVVAGDFRLT
jgi:Domain of unknown function (DUF397)